MDNAIVSPLYVVKTHVLPVSIKTVDSNARVLRFAISDQRRDRDEDVVRQRGLDKRNYRPNPLVYWAHQGDFVRAPDQLPIAKAVSVEVGDVKGLPTTFADKLFVPEEVGYELSRLTYDLARLGFINCCSIGFMRRKIAAVPKEYWTAEEQKAGKAERGYLIVDSELVESSLCGIPSNVGALAQRGLAPNPEWDVDRVREVARKHLDGAALDRFIGELTGPEVLTLRAVKPEEAPEPLRELLVKAAARFEDVDDLGFDDYELHVGKARPAPERKTASGGDEPLAIGDRVQVKPGREHMPEHKGVPGTVRIVSGTNIGIEFDGISGVHKWYAPDELQPASGAEDSPGDMGEPHDAGGEDSMGPMKSARRESVVETKTVSGLALILAQLTTLADRLTSAVERIEAAEIDDAAEAADPVETAADPMVACFVEEIRTEMKALAADVSARLERTERRVEDSHAEFYLAHLNSKSTAPHDTRSDPAPRVEAAKPPAAVAVKQLPAVDLSALVPQIAKALGAEVTKRVDAAIYTARGGIEIP